MFSFRAQHRNRHRRIGYRVRVENKRLEWKSATLQAAVNVRNLFYNVPVRRKFLRTTPTEMGHCTDIVLRTAMCRPDVSFVLTMDERTLLRAPKTQEAVERIGQLLGPDGRNLWSVQHESEELSVTGWISQPTVHRSSPKNSLFLIVNGRPVQDPLLKRSVSEVFRDA